MQESDKKETTTPQPLPGKEGRKNIPPAADGSAPFSKGDTIPALADSGTLFAKGDLPNWSAWQLAGELGYTIAIPIVVLALLGRWADRYFQTFPWLLLLGILLSIGLSSFLIYHKVKDVLK